MLTAIDNRPVRLVYQPPASSVSLSEQINHQLAVLFSQNKSATTISHQPNEQTAVKGIRARAQHFW
jgi:hypothetical protein